jgi:Protein of unknown function (DUF3455)
MRSRSTAVRLGAALGVAAAALAGTAVVQSADAAEQHRPPHPAPTGAAAPAPLTPDVLQALEDVTPGPGFRPASAYAVASGTQTYTCGADGTWPAASTPKATLTRLPFGGDRVEHFAGPRWQAADGSTVVGAVRTRVTRTGQLPWLLLDVTAHEGPAGALSPVTSVSRVLTRGGLPPTTSCTPGATTSPSYTAVYVFWVPTAPR